MTQREKIIEERLLALLERAPHSLTIENANSGARSLADLLSGLHFEKFHDNSAFNPFPKFMQDIIGGATPDIVLRSRISGQNRIYIEVKDSEPLHYGIEDSQIIRYFLHLLCTTTKVPDKATDDIKRAVLLCAPSPWFKKDGNLKTWKHFVEHYSGLAKAFDITIGELHSDAF